MASLLIALYRPGVEFTFSILCGTPFSCFVISLFVYTLYSEESVNVLIKVVRENTLLYQSLIEMTR